jgi:hypothetical protein
MTASDAFSEYYAELLQGTYDGVDRVVLNAFFPLGQTGGGLRAWWRYLRGDDSTLDDEHLRDMAGTFSRRLQAFCAKQGIPVIEAQAHDRKHELAQPYLPANAKSCGLFLVIKSTAPAPIWEVKRNGEGRITEIRHRKNWPYLCQAFLLSSDRSGVGSRHDQDVQLSAVWRAGDLERSPMGGAPGTAPARRRGQGRQLLYRRQRLCGDLSSGDRVERR